MLSTLFKDKHIVRFGKISTDGCSQFLSERITFSYALSAVFIFFRQHETFMILYNDES